MSEAERMASELENAGWRRAQRPDLWQSPGGALYHGPAGAWRTMKAGADKRCPNGHVWTHAFGDDWTPEEGTPCDCGGKLWGIPLEHSREQRRSY